MSSPSLPPTIQLRYGIPGLLATSGIALLAISIVHTQLFGPGLWLLLLGILTFFVKAIMRTVGDYYEEIQKGNYPETWETALLALFIIAMIALAIFIVVVVFMPLLA